MIKDKIYIFDTTLRDGAQTEGVDFSIEDKNKIAKVKVEILADPSKQWKNVTMPINDDNFNSTSSDTLIPVAYNISIIVKSLNPLIESSFLAVSNSLST